MQPPRRIKYCTEAISRSSAREVVVVTLPYRTVLEDMRSHPLPPVRKWVSAIAVVLGLFFGVALLNPDLVRPVVFLALLPLVIGVGLLAPSGLLYGLVAWLVALGLLRRLFDTAAGATSHAGLGDPLLLVEPVIMLVLVAVAFRRGALGDRTRLANAVLVLCVLDVVEAVNPLQGGPLVGLAGLLFLLVPMLAFWVGRSLVDERILRRLFVLIAALAVIAVIYGLFQQYRGLPSWDEAWVLSSGYTALNVDGVIRAFGTFSSSAEYATFLAIGVIICGAGFTRRAVAPLAIVVGALLAYGVFYDSSRGVVVLGAAALAIMWSARRRLRPVPALLGGVVGIFLVLAVAGHFAPQLSTSPAGNSALAQHQLEGLANPFNPQDSTLDGHYSEMLRGLWSAVTDPLGHGTGSVTIASSRYGGTSQGTEVDPSNLGVALGIPGLLGYIVVAAVGLFTAYEVASRTRRWWALAALGLLVVTFLQWSNGGQYAVAWLPWLALGWADRTKSGSRTKELPLHEDHATTGSDS
jgi:hypothetical protein